MARAYEKGNEWGDYTIEFGSTGFIVSYHTFREGESDTKVLVPYGTWGFDRKTDLDAAFDEISSNGEMLAVKALDEANSGAERCKVEVLSMGGAAPRAATTMWSGSMSSPTASQEAGSAAVTGWDAGSWYSFSVKKEDEIHYGDCHDLFTMMYLTHGLPRGMSLWDRSNLATDENVFFVHIPDGVDVSEDEFFRTFPLSRCESPSKVGLSWLVGDAEEAHRAESGGRWERFWRHAAFAGR